MISSSNLATKPQTSNGNQELHPASDRMVLRVEMNFTSPKNLFYEGRLTKYVDPRAVLPPNCSSLPVDDHTIVYDGIVFAVLRPPTWLFDEARVMFDLKIMSKSKLPPIKAMIDKGWHFSATSNGKDISVDKFTNIYARSLAKGTITPTSSQGKE